MKLIFIFICSFNLLFAFARQENQQCVSKGETDSILKRIKANRNNPVRQGKLKEINPNSSSTFSHSFIWPRIAAPNYHQPGFYYISNYVDLDPVYGADDTTTLKDYNCGHRTYDNPPPGNYDHSGIDIALGPFGWKMMDDENVYAVAAEGGVKVGKRNGEFSGDCTYSVSIYDDMRILPVQVFLLGTDLGTYRLLCTYNGQSIPYFLQLAVLPLKY